MEYLEFIETTAFSRLRAEIWDDETFQNFQRYLLQNLEEFICCLSIQKMKNQTLPRKKKPYLEQ